MKYRSSREILAEVLRSCKDKPASRTDLIHVAKAAKHVDLLLNRGLIARSSDGSFYVTGRGREFLAAVDHAEGMLLEVVR